MMAGWAMVMILLVSGLAPFLLSVPRMEGKPFRDGPNIIVIQSDDHGYGDLGSQGSMTGAQTPHLDRLAASGRIGQFDYGVST